jgi:uncharacterized protein YsxB (DUF464 family)
MINITFKPKTYELEINGHAGHGKKGKDIVCSAISCLFYTLGESLYEGIEMLEEAPIFKDEDGEGYLACTPKKEYEPNVSLIYWTILNGLQMVANNYPKNVKLRVEE